MSFTNQIIVIQLASGPISRSKKKKSNNKKTNRFFSEKRRIIKYYFEKSYLRVFYTHRTETTASSSSWQFNPSRF